MWRTSRSPNTTTVSQLYLKLHPKITNPVGLKRVSPLPYAEPYDQPEHSLTYSRPMKPIPRSVLSSKIKIPPAILILCRIGHGKDCHTTHVILILETYSKLGLNQAWDEMDHRRWESMECKQRHCCVWNLKNSCSKNKT